MADIDTIVIDIPDTADVPLQDSPEEITVETEELTDIVSAEIDDLPETIDTSIDEFMDELTVLLNEGEGMPIELQRGTTYIQWRYVGEENWRDLIAISELKGETGEQGIQGIQGEKGDKGETGEQGIQGIQGINGKSAYQSYLDTTTDNPKLTETQWANLMVQLNSTIGDIDAILDAINGEAL